MSKKDEKISALIERHRGQALDAHYLGYFECFNRGQYYEAHDVLEAMWLPVRKTEEGNFFKGLIQLAGAFVHLQKNRLGPAGALFALARTNLERYPNPPAPLDVPGVVRLIGWWQDRLQGTPAGENPWSPGTAPRLSPSVAGGSHGAG